MKQYLTARHFHGIDVIKFTGGIITEQQREHIVKIDFRDAHVKSIENTVLLMLHCLHRGAFLSTLTFGGLIYRPNTVSHQYLVGVSV